MGDSNDHIRLRFLARKKNNEVKKMKFDVFCDNCNNYLGVVYSKAVEMNNKHFCDGHCAKQYDGIIE